MPREIMPTGLTVRLARYLQILTQARKEGRPTVSSKALSEYAGVNSTQIRRDLSVFGKLGRRGVGYQVDLLIERIGNMLRTSRQANIAVLGAGNLGKAIVSSGIFTGHGIRIAALFDVNPAVLGERIGSLTVAHVTELKRTVAEQGIVAGILAVPAEAAPKSAALLVDAGVKIIFNYSEALIDAPAGVKVHPLNPAGELFYALYYYLQ